MQKPTFAIIFIAGFAPLAPYIGLAASEQQASGLQTDADAAARKLWDRLLTKCGDPYYLYSEQGDSKELFEYHRVHFGVTETRPPTTAQQMNGVEGSALAVMWSEVYRSRRDFPKGDWDKWWDGMRNMSMDEKTKRPQWDPVASSYLQRGREGVAGFMLTKYRGEWYIDVKPTSYDSMTAEHSLSRFAPPKLTCEAIQQGSAEAAKKGR